MESKRPWYSRAFGFIKALIIFILGVAYFFIYFASYMLSVAARIILGIAYFGMCDFRKSKDIFKFMFRRAPWDK